MTLAPSPESGASDMRSEFRAESEVDLERIAYEASAGSDDELEARDRRRRARISPRTDIASGTTVTTDGHDSSKKVIGPGRGEGWMLLAWAEDGRGLFGTYHESQVVVSR